jgi:hypothetical protein
MKAKFTRGSHDRLGIRFQPETFEEQLLLEQFTRNAHAIGHRFEFSGFETNAPGRSLREGLTSCWGQLEPATADAARRIDLGDAQHATCGPGDVVPLRQAVNPATERESVTLNVAEDVGEILPSVQWWARAGLGEPWQPVSTSVSSVVIAFPYEGDIGPGVIPLHDQGSDRNVGTVQVVDGEAHCTFTDEGIGLAMRHMALSDRAPRVIVKCIGDRAVLVAEAAKPGEAQPVPSDAHEDHRRASEPAVYIATLGTADEGETIEFAGTDIDAAKASAIGRESDIHGWTLTEWRGGSAVRAWDLDAPGVWVERGALPTHPAQTPAVSDRSTAKPTKPAPAGRCADPRGHKFADADSNRVYLYCQRGCGTRDPEEPVTSDEYRDLRAVVADRMIPDVVALIDRMWSEIVASRGREATADLQPGTRVHIVGVDRFGLGQVGTVRGLYGPYSHQVRMDADDVLRTFPRDNLVPLRVDALATGDIVKLSPAALIPGVITRWAGRYGKIEWIRDGNVRIDLGDGEHVTCGPGGIVPLQGSR